MNFQSSKYFPFYVDVAKAASYESVAENLKVGCCIVTSDGLIATGWNGTPSGCENSCEDSQGKTLPWVVHAERNALDKLSRSGVSPMGGILFTTHSPCIECAKSIYGVGIVAVYFINEFKRSEGLDFLMDVGVEVTEVECITN